MVADGAGVSSLLPSLVQSVRKERIRRLLVRRVLFAPVLTEEEEMRARVIFLSGVIAVLVAAGWSVSSSVWAQPVGDDIAVGDATVDDFDGRHPVVPEPATIALAGLGLAAMGVGYRRHKRP